MTTNATARMRPRTNTSAFTGAPTRADWIVIALVVLALGAGWFLRERVINRVTSFSAQNVTLQYPAGWLPTADDTPGTLLSVTGGESNAPFQPTLTIRTENAPPDAPTIGLGGIQIKRAVTQSRAIPAFRALGSAPTVVRGQKALATEYAYLYDPSINPLSNVSVPAVVRAQELLVLKGNTLYIITFATVAEDWERMQGDWNRIVRSINL